MSQDNGTTDVVAQLTAQVQDWLSGAPDSAQQPVPGAAVSASLVTNITPPIDLSGASSSSWGGQLMRWIQPTIVGSLPVVGPVNVAPYGAANPAVGTVVFYGVLALAGVGALKLLRGR